MKHSHLLNRRSIQRCINELLRSLQLAGLLDQYRDTVRSLQEKPGMVRFPGFSMLTPSAPYQLFVPAPTCDIPDFINYYEEFADRPLGKMTRAGEVAAKVYAGNREGREMMTFLREHDEWRTPALLMLAAARHLGSEAETYNDDYARSRLGPAVLEVTADGCYSNFRKAIHPCYRRSPDTPATVLRSASSRHPALTALEPYLEEIEYADQHMACALALALQVGELTDKDLLDGVLVSKIQSAKTGPKGRETAEEILRTQSNGVVKALYEVLVPGSMTSREFRAKFGNPHKSTSQTFTRPSTRERWLELLS